MLKALAALDQRGRRSLQDELLTLADASNRNKSGALTIDAEYLEVVAIRRDTPRL
jgi:hypothetical protein